jgi:hypothetical protein
MSDRAILAQTQSSDAWAEYQADSIKARVVETAILTAPTSPNLDALTKEAKELRDRQPALHRTATQKAAERDEHLKDGGKRLAERDQLVYAGFRRPGGDRAGLGGGPGPLAHRLLRRDRRGRGGGGADDVRLRAPSAADALSGRTAIADRVLYESVPLRGVP